MQVCDQHKKEKSVWGKVSWFLWTLAAGIWYPWQWHISEGFSLEASVFLDGDSWVSAVANRCSAFPHWGFWQSPCKLLRASLHLSSSTQQPSPSAYGKAASSCCVLVLQSILWPPTFLLEANSQASEPPKDLPGSLCGPTAAHPSSGQRTSDFSYCSPEALSPAPPPTQESCFLCLPDVMGELCG